MPETAFATHLLSWRPRTIEERFGWALALAVALHAAAILGVNFVVPRSPPALPSLEVTLTQFKEEAPKRADFVAPTNQAGSGDASKGMEDQVTIKSAESRLIVERGRIVRIVGISSAPAERGVAGETRPAS